MNIIGLDLSLTSSGFCLSDNIGIVKTNTKGAERLSYVSNFIVELCKENSISIAIIEGYAFSARNSHSHSIGELGGCVRMKLWESNIPYIEIAPTARAKFATGKGNASKSEVVSSVSSKTGLIFDGSGADDKCDAWILREMCLAKTGMSKYDWTKEQLSALNKVDWSPMEEISDI